MDVNFAISTLETVPSLAVFRIKKFLHTSFSFNLHNNRFDLEESGVLLVFIS